MLKLIRSNKTINKPPVAAVSTGLAGIRKQQMASKERSIVGKSHTSASKHRQSEQGGLWSTIKSLFRWLGSMLLNKSFSFDELLAIFRPVVYIYSVLKFGRRSYKPIQISILFDVCQLVISAIRLWRSKEGQEGALS